jgi:hypothetical protein
MPIEDQEGDQELLPGTIARSHERIPDDSQEWNPRDEAYGLKAHPSQYATR